MRILENIGIDDSDAAKQRADKAKATADTLKKEQSNKPKPKPQQSSYTDESSDIEPHSNYTDLAMPLFNLTPLAGIDPYQDVLTSLLNIPLLQTQSVDPLVLALQGR
jgi:hypothetical protein